MAVLSKGCKPDNLESHKSPNFSFTNICCLHLNFVDCESFLESNSPEILALCQTHLDDSVKFFLLGFTPCKAEQPLQGKRKLKEKEAQKD